MANKDSMLAAIDRSMAVFDAGVAVLESWEIHAGTSSGRAASCRLARRRLTEGAGAPSDKMAGITDRARSAQEAEVVAPPSNGSLEAIQQLETTAEARQGTVPGSFGPGPAGSEAFSVALNACEDDARRAVDLAEAILNECRPESGPPGAAGT